ncbi:MAG: SDR family oxidoreductase [bacterium]
MEKLKKMKNLFNLKSSVVVITGGYGYLGKAISQGLSLYNAKVYVLGRSQQKFNQVFDNSTMVKFIECDITDSISVNKAFSLIMKNEGMVTHLINNVTYTGNLDCARFPTLDSWNKGINSNLSSMYNCIKEIVPFFEKNKISKIINTSSMYGFVAPDFSVYDEFPDYLNPSVYGVSKAGVIQLTKYFSSYLAKQNILVNTVSPGPFPNQDVQKNKAFVKKLSQKTLLNRIGNPEELVGTYIYLCSDASNYMTGQNIVVDGGWTVR